jgi:hypothetical protein
LRFIWTYMSKPKPYFIKYLLSGIFCLAISRYLLETAYKDKTSFHNITGPIEFVSSRYLDLPKRDTTKFRYIKLRGYENPFEVFVGKDLGDFKPALDKTELLKRGETLTVYYEEDVVHTSGTPVNRHAYYMDLGTLPVFVSSPSQVYLAWFLMGVSILVIVIVLIGKWKGKLI